MRLYTSLWNINAKKLAIIDNKLVGKRNTLLAKNAVNDLYDVRLC